jgi:hypothetical protein
MTRRATLGYMNPIALIEAPAGARRAVLGALATDPVVPSRTAATPASQPNRRSSRRLGAAGAAGPADDGKRTLVSAR